jgi:hypothetical protein
LVERINVGLDEFDAVHSEPIQRRARLGKGRGAGIEADDASSWAHKFRQQL